MCAGVYHVCLKQLAYHTTHACSRMVPMYVCECTLHTVHVIKFPNDSLSEVHLCHWETCQCNLERKFWLFSWRKLQCYLPPNICTTKCKDDT